MTTYVVSYDLKKPGQNYQPLWDELDRLKAHRTLESFWLISVNNTPKELVDHLKSFIDANDALWVLELTKVHHFRNAKAGTNDWLAKNPPAR